MVTGATRGIGKAIAIRLASKGVNLLVTGRSVDKLCEICNLAGQYEVKIHSLVADIKDPETPAMLMDDLMQLEGLAEARHPGLPVFVLGHSMGSLLARCFAADYGRDLAGLVLSGTPADPGITGMAGQILATLMLAAGPLRENRTLDRLLFGRGNARIPEAKTPFDWLTRDDTAVSTYMEDPNCGFVYPTAFYHELIRGARLAWSTGTFRGTPPELPVYLLGGDEDPMGNYGQALRDAADRYRKAGLQDVTVRLYPGGRHEMFNELNREDVFRETALWMEEKIVNWKG